MYGVTNLIGIKLGLDCAGLDAVIEVVDLNRDAAVLDCTHEGGGTHGYELPVSELLDLIG